MIISNTLNMAILSEMTTEESSSNDQELPDLPALPAGPAAIPPAMPAAALADHFVISILSLGAGIMNLIDTKSIGQAWIVAIIYGVALEILATNSSKISNWLSQTANHAHWVIRPLIAGSTLVLDNFPAALLMLSWFIIQSPANALASYLC